MVRFFLALNCLWGLTTHNNKHDQCVYGFLLIQQMFVIISNHIHRGFELLYLFSIIIHYFGVNDISMEGRGWQNHSYSKIYYKD